MAKIKKSDVKKVVTSSKGTTNDIDGAIMHIRKSISKINGGMEILKPEKLAIVEKNSNKNIDKNELKFSGADRKNSKTIQRNMEHEMEDKYKKISQYTSGGMYKKLFMAKQNKYLSGEFPNLKKSLKLFTTDVCYGSFFASDVSSEKFIIYENGIPITDKNIKESIINIINPPATKKTDVTNMSFDNLDFEATGLSRQDGYSCIRMVSNKKVLTDLYIKYVMKDAKNKSRKSAVESVKLKDDYSLESLNSYLEEIGFVTKKLDLNSNLVNELPERILNTIPESFVNRSSTANKKSVENTKRTIQPLRGNNPSGNTQIGLESATEAPGGHYDGFEDYEGNVYHNETFKEFAYRMLSGKASTTAVYKNHSLEDDSKIHAYGIGYGPTSYETSIGMDIYNETFSNDHNFGTGLESDINESLSTLSSKLNIFDKTALSKVNFEDIYALDTNLVEAKIKNTISSSIQYGIEKHVLKKENVKKRVQEFSPLESIVKNILTDDHSVIPGIESEIIDIANNLTIENGNIIGLEGESTNFVTINGIKDNSYVKNGSVKLRADTDRKFDEVSSKIPKMFNNVKGVNTVQLDNRRLIPAMMGSKNNGAFYIEKTHAEIEHLIATRSVMSSPITGGDSTSSLFQLDEEAKEETMGRLIFSDTIKPLIDRNMSTKFLKDNADLMYTIKELLEENETSKTDKSFGAFNNMGYFNMSKVSYIPADELIMYTNGPGLGESVYEDAFTPANAYVLARESYLSWLLVDGKGFCIVEVPKGLSSLEGEYGAGHFTRIIEEQMCTRIGLKTGSTDNLQLSKKIIPMALPDELIGKINITDIKPPDFEIDTEIIGKWQEEATGIVGYPASLFSTLDGGGIELAKKIESMNSSIVLDVIQSQDRKQQSSNALATTLLHLRGGKEYEKYTVEWVAPRPSRTSDTIRKDMVVEKRDVLASYMDIYEAQLGDLEDWAVVKPHLFNIISKTMYKDDKFLNSMDDFYKEARSLANIKLSSTADEQ